MSYCDYCSKALLASDTVTIIGVCKHSYHVICVERYRALFGNNCYKCKPPQSVIMDKEHPVPLFLQFPVPSNDMPVRTAMCVEKSIILPNAALVDLTVEMAIKGELPVLMDRNMALVTFDWGAPNAMSVVVMQHILEERERQKAEGFLQRAISVVRPIRGHVIGEAGIEPITGGEKQGIVKLTQLVYSRTTVQEMMRFGFTAKDLMKARVKLDLWLEKGYFVSDLKLLGASWKTLISMGLKPEYLRMINPIELISAPYNMTFMMLMTELCGYSWSVLAQVKLIPSVLQQYGASFVAMHQMGITIQGWAEFNYIKLADFKAHLGLTAQTLLAYQDHVHLANAMGWNHAEIQSVLGVSIISRSNQSRGQQVIVPVPEVVRKTAKQDVANVKAPQAPQEKKSGWFSGPKKIDLDAIASSSVKKPQPTAPPKPRDIMKEVISDALDYEDEDEEEDSDEELDSKDVLLRQYFDTRQNDPSSLRVVSPSEAQRNGAFRGMTIETRNGRNV